MNVLLSAYACEPNRGSEPAVGWNIAIQIARFHDVWVLTRSSNRAAIEAELKVHPQSRMHWEYLDPSALLSFWKRGARGLLPFYYIWQFLAYRRARELSARIAFDLIHHVTLTQYWTPSYLALLKPPFVWGPLGGADGTPYPLMKSLSRRGRILEYRRRIVQLIGAADPYLRTTAHRASLTLAATAHTATRMKSLGCRRIESFECFGLSVEELDRLAQIPIRTNLPVRFFSSGRLLGWKGFHIGLAAFARIHRTLSGSDYWIFGDGPDRKRLMRLAQDLGIGSKVRFFGERPREEVLALMSECDVIIHPSFHDAGAMVCNESMAAGRPVICLDLGGPAGQVTDGVGFKIAAGDPAEMTAKIAAAMAWCGHNPDARTRMGVAARVDARTHSWSNKGECLAAWYDQVVGARRHTFIPVSSAAISSADP